MTVLDASSKDRFPRDYQARFRDAFRAEIADFVAVCAAAKHGDAASATGPSSSGLAATLDDDRLAVATGVAARASAVQERRLTVGEDWPWPSAPTDDADEQPAAAGDQMGRPVLR